MKLKVLSLLAVLLIMSSVAFSQDAGNPDSLKIGTSTVLVVGVPSQTLAVTCSTKVDVNSLTTLQFALTWDYVDMVIDSVKPSAPFDAMEIGPFYFLDDNIAISNDSDIVLCSGTSLFSNFPVNANWQNVATFYFTVNNWSAARASITIDTIQHPDYSSDDYFYIPAGAGQYGPIWLGPLNISSSAVGENDPNNIPTSFELGQNFPNPFNPTTTINYALPTKSQVSIKIYNLLGQEITSLVNMEMPAGTYVAEWDGRDKNNTDVASGIYFYKLIAGDFVETKKMMLIK